MTYKIEVSSASQVATTVGTIYAYAVITIIISILRMKSLLLLLYTISGCLKPKVLRRENSIDLSRWNPGQEADADQLLQVSIALTIGNVDHAVETLMRISDPASPDYGQHLSTKEVVRMFEPTPNVVSNVMEWLHRSGINESQVSLSHGGGHLDLTVSVGEAASLFETTFFHHTHQDTGQEEITCPYYHIPASLAESIDYMMATAPVLTRRLHPRQQVALGDRTSTPSFLQRGCPEDTYPSCIRALYGIPEGIHPHPNNSFGVFEPSWVSWLQEDLDMFFKFFQPDMVGSHPKIDAVNGGYLQENLTGLPYNLEPNLDFEYTMALTWPQAVTNVEVGSHDQVGNVDDMLAAFDRFYCDPVNEQYKNFPRYYKPGCNATSCDCGSSSPPKVLSISYGWTEAAFSPNYLQRQCLEFLKLGLMGTTVVVSVSDYGTTSGPDRLCIDDHAGGGTSGKFSPTFPSSCPWVTSVGGTQMLQSTKLATSNATTEETAFRQELHGNTLSSGGGFSNVFLSPPYQIPNVALYRDMEKEHLSSLKDRFSEAGRGYPDVAALANNYMVASNRKWTSVSGTSASNPVFASIITLINSERMHVGKTSVGFINPVLYSNPGVVNDIVTGANLGCGVDPAFRATRGWDAVTGLGTPNYERMRHLFMSLP